jgi:DNA-binding protein HU-beta
VQAGARAGVWGSGKFGLPRQAKRDAVLAPAGDPSQRGVPLLLPPQSISVDALIASGGDGEEIRDPRIGKKEVVSRAAQTFYKQQKPLIFSNISKFSACTTSAIPFNSSRVERLSVNRNNKTLTEKTMAKAMSKSQIATTIAEKVGVTKKQAVQTLDLLADLAYKQAKNTFTLPGLGKLVLQNRPARQMVMQFGPDKGKTKTIPAKRVVKFRVAKAAKDAILGAK